MLQTSEQSGRWRAGTQIFHQTTRIRFSLLLKYESFRHSRTMHSSAERWMFMVIRNLLPWLWICWLAKWIIFGEKKTLKCNDASFWQRKTKNSSRNSQKLKWRNRNWNQLMEQNVKNMWHQAKSNMRLANKQFLSKYLEFSYKWQRKGQVCRFKQK